MFDKQIGHFGLFKDGDLSSSDVRGMSVMSEELKDQEVVTEAAAPVEAAPVEEAPIVEEENMDMAALMAQYEAASEEIARGRVIQGVVVSKTDGGWLIDVGYKCEGFLPEREWSHHILVGDREAPEIGETLSVQVTSKRDGEEAQLLVSRWRTEFDKRWAALEAATADNAIVTVKGLRKVKGGLMVDCCGLEGFIPISHLAEEGRGVNPGRFEGEDIQVRLLEKDKRKRRLVLSRRNILDETLKASREKFYAETEVGAIFDGTVSSVTTFGLFVNIGPLDGLVHISEISWQRSGKNRETYKKGDAVKVKVIGIDRENNKISLSIRQALGNPWDTVLERWEKGKETKGIVTNLTDFGAFVEVEPGIEGLIHIGDLSWSRIKHPREVLHKGQEIDTIVLDIDATKRRMSLGYKQLNDPWKDVDTRYAKGQDLTVKVVRLADFGAFVEIEKGVEGLIHISQLSTRRVEKPGDVLQEGQEVVARVLEVNAADRRIRLSIKEIENAAKQAERAAARAAQGDRPERPARGDRSERPAKGDRPAKRRRPEPERNNSYSEDTGVTLADIFGNIKL